MLKRLLKRQACTLGDKVYAVFETGQKVSYRQLLADVDAFARVLAGLGVGNGDRVLLMMPNSPQLLTAWYAVNYVGAIAVPVNTMHRGAILQRIVQDCRPRLAVLDESVVDLFAALADVCIPHVLVSGPCGPDRTLPLGCLTIDAARASAVPAHTPVGEDMKPWDTQLIIYTSGTTGMSKGVVCPYRQLEAFGESLEHLGGDDRFLANLPIYHIGGCMPCWTMLTRGGSIAVTNGFSAQRFWPFVMVARPTFAVLLGSMAAVLLRHAPDDARGLAQSFHRLCIIPFGSEALVFGERFGVPLMTTYSMTELSGPLVSGLKPSTPGLCGQVRKGYEARIVDDNDCERPHGEVGELVVRADEPWTLAQGYHDQPQATAVAWRNGWFHTGDAFRRDAQGNFFFVDRIKDVIRRRGENVSSFELELEVMSHPAVDEAAAIPVPSPLGEDDILVVVVSAAGLSVDPAQLVAYLEGRVSRFMMPRYVRVVSHLPKTPTQKVMKHVLRADGLAGAWDREAQQQCH